MPIIIFGGILGGIFTATEAAVVAVVYALFVDAVVYRELTWKKLVSVLVRAAHTTGVVMLLIAASTIFSWFLTLQQVPQLLTDFIVGNNLPSPVVILLIIVFFLFLGAVMDGLAAMIMAVPILLPVFATVGLDPFHMGIVIVATTGLGIYTPPVGAGLFVACSVGRVSIEETTVAMFPYLVIVTLSVVLIAYVPGIVTFLPRILGLI
jgi:C4-dicarboxylate transporter DctM subunit